MENAEIREKIYELRLKNYEIAAEIGITPETFCRWLQVPLVPEKRNRVETAMKKLCRRNQEIYEQYSRS